MCSYNNITIAALCKWDILTVQFIYILLIYVYMVHYTNMLAMWIGIIIIIIAQHTHRTGTCIVIFMGLNVEWFGIVKYLVKATRSRTNGLKAKWIISCTHSTSVKHYNISIYSRGMNICAMCTALHVHIHQCALMFFAYIYKWDRGARTSLILKKHSARVDLVNVCTISICFLFELAGGAL